ncbi:hypothetical protein PLEOSDRAFT_1084210 [Pleurotus ostreatus PC15]|uniref:EXPERA domain-containing protein n=1 Tax=Pleurotus ostreatus (strain PC15) TaxID=1137138 RepID=A0A067NWH3_PLEO1|nr:hypothetical protein PLEOSDRAFT_1084210 [Pleurotus ostreatus PC15]
MYDPIKTSLGALHISSGISAFFLGCLVLQAYRYFSDYPRDSKWIKSLIALMLLSELALHMTITEVSYIMTIIHAGDPFVFLHISSSQLAPPLFLSVLAIPMNEIFYYWRIYRLNQEAGPTAHYVDGLIPQMLSFILVRVPPSKLDVSADLWIA